MKCHSEFPVVSLSATGGLVSFSSLFWFDGWFWFSKCINLQNVSQASDIIIALNPKALGYAEVTG